MMVYIFYRKDAPGFDVLERYAQELSGGPVGLPVELIEADSRQGVTLTEVYDVLERPAMVLVDGNKSSVKTWTGEFPQPSEVRYLAGSL